MNTLLKLKPGELREIIRNADKQPFVVHMDNGATYKVTHPDFARLAADTLIIAASPDQDLGGRDFVLCLLENVSRLDFLKKKPKAR
jgi:hypothetical protein